MKSLTVRSLLKNCHRWIGFPVGLIFLMTFGTGFLTSIDELISRTVIIPASSQQPYQALTTAQKAKAIGLFNNLHADIQQITLPTPLEPYYQVSMRAEAFFYETDTLEEIGYYKKSREGFFPTVLQLHRNLLLGNKGFLGFKGAHYVAWAGLISLLISLIGIIIWWPLRRTFSWRDSVPRGTQRKNWYYSHMTAGVMSSAAIIVLAITGAAITYRDIAKSVLDVKEKAKTQHDTIVALDKNWHHWLEYAHKTWPDARLVSIQFPRNRPTNDSDIPGRQLEQQKERQPQGNPEPIITLRFLTPEDWFGLPNSKLYIQSEKSQLAGVEPFSSLTLGAKIYSIIVPLHTGRNLSAIYVVVLMLFSLIGTVMVLSGVVSFVLKKRKFKLKNTVLKRLAPMWKSAI